MKQEKLLNKETYQGLLDLLLAHSEDKAVAFEIIENTKDKEPFLILKLVKESHCNNIDASDWQMYAPNTVAFLARNGYDMADYSEYPPSNDLIFKYIKNKSDLFWFIKDAETFWNNMLTALAPNLSKEYKIKLEKM